MTIKSLSQKYVIHLSFNGSNFYGWQVQQRSVSVQQLLNNALNILLKEDIQTTGAGRTDKGVHASYFIAHFESVSDLPVTDSNFIFRLNRILPNDICIHNIVKVRDDFHARYSAIKRTYHYLISRKKTCFFNGLSLHIYGKLDIQSMKTAAGMLSQYIDFTSFSRLHGNAKTNNCKIFESEWYEENEFLIFRICADRFLRNMVRALAGTMLDIGKGKIDVNDFKKIIEIKNRSAAGKSADAKGLFLTGIVYPEEFGIPEPINKFPEFLFMSSLRKVEIDL